jgi:succinate dehydrogenase / fumarate reductase flavoprotein subunit
MREYVGMSRNEKGLKIAIKEIKKLRDLFWQEIFVPGDMHSMNKELEKATRVLDFLWTILFY